MLGKSSERSQEEEYLIPTDRRLLDIWRRGVGPQIAAQTYPDSLKGDLFVRSALSDASPSS